MKPEELLRRIQQRPFSPFRIHLSDGSALEVRHPEMVLPGRRTALIGIPAPADNVALMDDYVAVDVAHITHMEPVKAPVGGTGPQETAGNNDE